MKQTLKFCKMHGLGNDFMLVDATANPVSISSSLIKQFSNRHTGIGFDQLLLVLPSSCADFSCRIFNADGSEAEQCGNGMRCVARFVHETKLIDNNTLTLETQAGIIPIVIHDYDNIEVNMGIPHLEHRQLSLAGLSPLTLSILSMGNPHAILQVQPSQEYSFLELGAQIGTHPQFPNGTNVGFMQILNRQSIHLRTFERGVGETFACGSNACAAVVAGIWNNLLDKKVKVELTLGSLCIEWAGETEPVFMTGSATLVFDGVVLLN